MAPHMLGKHSATELHPVRLPSAVNSFANEYFIYKVHSLEMEDPTNRGWIIICYRSRGTGDRSPKVSHTGAVTLFLPERNSGCSTLDWLCPPRLNCSL